MVFPVLASTTTRSPMGFASVIVCKVRHALESPPGEWTSEVMRTAVSDSTIFGVGIGVFFSQQTP